MLYFKRNCLWVLLIFSVFGVFGTFKFVNFLRWGTSAGLIWFGERTCERLSLDGMTKGRLREGIASLSEGILKGNCSIRNGFCFMRNLERGPLFGALLLSSLNNLFMISDIDREMQLSCVLQGIRTEKISEDLIIELQKISTSDHYYSTQTQSGLVFEELDWRMKRRLQPDEAERCGIHIENALKKMGENASSHPPRLNEMVEETMQRYFALCST